MRSNLPPRKSVTILVFIFELDHNCTGILQLHQRFSDVFRGIEMWHWTKMG